MQIRCDIQVLIKNHLKLLFMVALWNRADHYIFILWLRAPAVEHRSLAGVLSLSCVRLVADG